MTPPSDGPATQEMLGPLPPLLYTYIVPFFSIHLYMSRRSCRCRARTAPPQPFNSHSIPQKQLQGAAYSSLHRLASATPSAVCYSLRSFSVLASERAHPEAVSQSSRKPCHVHSPPIRCLRSARPSASARFAALFVGIWKSATNATTTLSDATPAAAAAAAAAALGWKWRSLWRARSFEPAFCFETLNVGCTHVPPQNCYYIDAFKQPALLSSPSRLL